MEFKRVWNAIRGKRDTWMAVVSSPHANLYRTGSDGVMELLKEHGKYVQLPRFFVVEVYLEKHVLGQHNIIYYEVVSYNRQKKLYIKARDLVDNFEQIEM